MDFYQLITTRRTVHSYLPEKVPDAILQRAIECAIHAPIHRLTFPWRFFYVGPETKAKIAALEIEAKRKKFLGGGEIIVLGLEKSSRPDVAEEDYASLACAVQNMSLYLWSEGFGTKWATGAITQNLELHELLGTSPDKVRLCGFLWVGKPEAVPARPERPPVESLFFRR